MAYNRIFYGQCAYCEQPEWICKRCYWLKRLKGCETEEQFERVISQIPFDPFEREEDLPDEPLPF